MEEPSTSGCSFVGSMVAPGDAVLRLPETGEVRIGAGLQMFDGHIVSTKAGTLRQTRTGKLWIEGRQKRYIPAEDDVVIGTVLDRHVENFAVDIGAPFIAQLPQLSFEGATKRNRPNLQAGDVVYARVVSANRDMEAVLTCVDSLGRSAGFGQLKEGYSISCSTAHARQLLAKPPAPVLQALGQALQFEVAVGLNGRVWINSPSTANTIIVANVLSRSEYLSAAQAQQLVKSLLAQRQ